MSRGDPRKNISAEYGPGRRRWQRSPRRWDDLRRRAGNVGKTSSGLYTSAKKGKRGGEMPNPRGQKINQRNWRSASRQDRASQMGWSLRDCRKRRGIQHGLQAGGCSWTRRGSDWGQKLHGEEQRAPQAVPRRSRSSTIKKAKPEECWRKRG
ncbi:hypothetical protein BJX68DRAFT_14418 [Aspergillus pseudodeflectus]|uniref:Uncharacterized protein n=1 Tax=Aspergillus pseudodeflectus TaxID=176178 RepID=A0ABR4LBT1_9EURO